MVTSKTKYMASELKIKELFSFHKVGNEVEILPLGNGEINAVYRVDCENRDSYVLKIAPSDTAGVLSYEKTCWNLRFSGMGRCTTRQIFSVHM